MKSRIVASALLFISLLTCGSADTVFDRIAKDLSNQGFVIFPDHPGTDIPFGFEASWANKAKGLAVTLAGGQCGSEAAVARRIQIMRGIDLNYATEKQLKGPNIGDHSFGHQPAPRAISPDTEDTWFVTCDRYTLEVTVVDMLAVDSNLKIRTDRPAEEVDRQFKATHALCEKLARRVLGEALAMDINDDGSPRATAHLTGIESDKTGIVPLDDWAKANHVTVTYDDSIEVASFIFHNKAVQLPLAAKRIVVNGNEVELGRKFIMAKGKRWFVPSAELTKAIGS